MGGKFWVDIEAFRVSCYSEDRNDVRVRAIAEMNRKLEPLFNHWRSLCDGTEEELSMEDRANLIAGGIPCGEWPYCEELAAAFDEVGLPWCAARAPKKK
jgi:hypothetical protein